MKKMRLSKIIDSRSRLLLLSGDGVCACAQSRSCYCTQYDCCNAEVTGLRSGRIVCGTIAAAGAAAIGRTAVAAACCGSRSFTCRSGLARICGCAVRICILRCLSGRCRISGCSAAAGIDAAYSKVNNNLVSCCQTARNIRVNVCCILRSSPCIQNVYTKCSAVIVQEHRMFRRTIISNCSLFTAADSYNFNRVDRDFLQCRQQPDWKFPPAQTHTH